MVHLCVQVTSRQTNEHNEKARLRHKHAMARVKLERVSIYSNKGQNMGLPVLEVGYIAKC